MGLAGDSGVDASDTQSTLQVPPGSRSTTGAHRGQMIGRYVVLDELGAGGMGFVVRAYDPTLRREVALKRLHPKALDIEGEARMVREAQSMARLSHSNVVAVYDVEAGDDGITIVMEYVAGTTLRQWLRQSPRSTNAIVDVFRRAGSALAAAHRAGIVHRDFKPGNVLVAEDGSPKVTDFGLAKAVRASDSASSSLSLDGGLSNDDEPPELTRPDSIMGTPRYMAPEQHQGKSAGPAADQYAFCVALWGALCGAPPFAGETLEDIWTEKEQGPPPWPRDVAAPRQLRAAIARGLAPRPEDRWEDVDALLLRLEVHGGRRRGLAIVAGAVAVLGVVGAYELYVERAGLCSGAHALVERAWGSDQRARVRAAIGRAPVHYARSTSRQVDTLLDAFAERWAEQHREACEATAVRSEQSTEVLDARMACLHRARIELQTTVELLEKADEALVEKAVEFVQHLPPLELCSDLDALHSNVAPPAPESRDAVESIREALAVARSHQHGLDVERALDLTQEQQRRAETIGYAPVTAEVMLLLSNILADAGKYDDSLAAGKQALDHALASGAWRTAVEAAQAVAFIHGQHKEEATPSLIYAEVARAMIEHVEPNGALEGGVHVSLAAAHVAGGDYESAGKSMRRNLEIQMAAHGEQHPRTLAARNDLAAALYHLGRYDEAIEQMEGVIAARTELLGPTHPTTIRNRSNIATVYLRQGRNAEAVAIFRDVLGAMVTAQGSDHPDIGQVRMNLATALQQLGKTDEAIEETRNVLEHWSKAFGAEHVRVAQVRTNLANALALDGRYEEAREHYRKAISVFEKQGEHPNLCYALHGLGAALHVEGRNDDAIPILRRGVELCKSTMGAEHPMVADTAVVLATALEEAGSVGEAHELREQAWRLIELAQLPPAKKAKSALGLAESLWEVEGDHERARELAMSARALLDDDRDSEQVAAIEVWLRSHPGN